MAAACLRIGGLLNQADLARDVGLAPSTVQRYLDLLEVSFQLVRLPAYSVNRTKRLIKSSKLYWSDTGLALHLAGDAHPRGAHLENLVVCDLLAWAGARFDRPEILFWRTTKGAEVGFVIETGRRLLPVEVKAAATVHPGDVRHVHTFLDEYSDMAQCGILALRRRRDVLAHRPRAGRPVVAGGLKALPHCLLPRALARTQTSRKNCWRAADIPAVTSGFMQGLGSW